MQRDAQRNGASDAGNKAEGSHQGGASTSTADFATATPKIGAIEEAAARAAAAAGDAKDIAPATKRGREQVDGEEEDPDAERDRQLPGDVL